MTDRNRAAEAEWSALVSKRNWGRWGPADQIGAVNEITAAKIRAAVQLVQRGECVSLGRDVNSRSHGETKVTVEERPEGATFALDGLCVEFHGRDTTHLDALGHASSAEGMWNGQPLANNISPDGLTWGGVTAWSSGIVTRGVLLDVPRYRRRPSVEIGSDVTAKELEDVERQQGFCVGPGDAVFIYSGREPWERQNGEVWGSGDSRPGLDPDCLEYLRSRDVAVLGWDMLDARPSRIERPSALHDAIWAFGIAFLDNVKMDELVRRCGTIRRWEFLVIVAPLVIPGGTGSPVNPIAVF